MIAILLGSSLGAQGQLAPIETVSVDSEPDDAVPRYEPWGVLEVPEDARKVHLDLDWNLTGRSALDGAYVDVCKRSCENRMDPYNRTAAQPPLTWIVELPNTDELGWTVRHDADPTTPVNATGRVTFLGPTDTDPATGSAPESTARTPPAEGLQSSSDAWAMTVLGGGTLVAALAFVLGRWGPGVVGLYHRVTTDEALDNQTRRRIWEIVREEPGVHLSEIRRRVETGGGTLQHHLQVLKDAGLVLEGGSDGYRCWFPTSGVDREIVESAAKLRSATARRLLCEALQNREVSLSQLADAADVAASTASYHIDRLAEANLVVKRRAGSRLAIEATEIGEQAVETLEIGT